MVRAEDIVSMKTTILEMFIRW